MGRLLGLSNPPWALSIPACSYLYAKSLDNSFYCPFLRVMFTENNIEE